MFRVSCFIFLCLMLLVSCSAQRMAAQLAFPLVQGQYKAMQEEADLGLAAEAIPSNLKMMEGLLKGDESS
ncbi:MAG TPA: hypothetical protein QGF86_06560, partial [Nitrospinaceae bacterium]|nr:hypothetical protein [Nitrospinaceae bacterium]